MSAKQTPGRKNTGALKKGVESGKVGNNNARKKKTKRPRQKKK